VSGGTLPAANSVAGNDMMYTMLCPAQLLAEFCYSSGKVLQNLVLLQAALHS
jgi:hypothetical protein